MTTEPCTPAVLGRVAEILLHDFEGQFKPLFEQTADLLQGRPLEPEHEAFNALDHLSNALRQAARADDPGTPPVEADAARLNAQRQLWQARRHISTGRFFCVEHQILSAMNHILEHTEKLSHINAADQAALQLRGTELEEKFHGFAELEIKPLFDLNDLEQSIDDLARKIEGLIALLDEFFDLSLEVAALGQAAPAP